MKRTQTRLRQKVPAAQEYVNYTYPLICLHILKKTRKPHFCPYIKNMYLILALLFLLFFKKKPN